MYVGNIKEAKGALSSFVVLTTVRELVNRLAVDR
jgi:hypothetical protein